LREKESRVEAAVVWLTSPQLNLFADRSSCLPPNSCEEEEEERFIEMDEINKAFELLLL